MTRTDILTSAQRSYCMSRIRGRDTKPEILLRKELWHLGLRYRLKSSLPGKPDLTFPRYRSVVFIDGCFWHGCSKHMVNPKTNREFWLNKIDRNRNRDREVNKLLRSDGWRVIRIWEHEIKNNRRMAILRVYERIVGKNK